MKPNGSRTQRTPLASPGQFSAGFRGPDALDLGVLAGFQLTGSRVELLKKQPGKPPQLQPIASSRPRRGSSDERDRADRLPELPSVVPAFNRSHSHSTAAALDLEPPRAESSRKSAYAAYPINVPYARRPTGFDEHTTVHVNMHRELGPLDDLAAWVHMTDRPGVMRNAESLPALAVSGPALMPPKLLSMSDPGTSLLLSPTPPPDEPPTPSAHPSGATPRGGVAFTIGGGDETVKVPRRRKKKEPAPPTDDDPVAKELVAYLTAEPCQVEAEEFTTYARTTVKKFGLQSILDVISHSANNESLLESVRQLFAVLATYTKFGKSCAELAKKSGTRFVLSAMRKYDDGKVLLYALKTLMNLSKKEKKFSLFARLEGGIAAVIGSLKRHDQEDFLREALKFLATLSQRNSNNAAAMLKSKAVPEILDIIRQHGSDIQLLETSVGLLGNLSRQDSNVKEFLRTANCDTIRLMLDLADKHRDNVPVLSRSLVVLKHLAADESSRSVVREHLKLFNDLIKQHQEEPVVLNALCGVIWRISVQSKRSPIPKSGITFNLGGPQSISDSAAPVAVLAQESADTAEAAELVDEIVTADGDNFGEDELLMEDAEPDENEDEPDEEEPEKLDDGADGEDNDEATEAQPGAEELEDVEPIDDPRVSTPQLDTSELRRLFPELFLHEEDARAAGAHPAYTSQSLAEPDAYPPSAEAPVRYIKPKSLLDDPPSDSESEDPVDPTVDPLPESLLQPSLPPPPVLVEGVNQVFATPKTFSLTPIRHLRHIPPVPEPLHSSDTNRLTIEMMMHDLELMSSAAKSRVVFDSLEPDKAQWQPGDLRFEASFECGNCRKVVWLADDEYDVVTNTDVNASSHTQWFYFAISNMRPDTTYKFNIINFEKPTSEFNRGMRPLFYSENEAAARSVGWVRCGERICYYRNQYARKTASKTTNYWTLTFELKFPHANDTCYLTTCYPYTVTQLKEELQRFDSDPRLRDRYRRGVLCKSSVGNVCDLLTITNFASCARLSNGFVERLISQVSTAAAPSPDPSSSSSDGGNYKEPGVGGTMSRTGSTSSFGSMETAATVVVPTVQLPLPGIGQGPSGLTPRTARTSPRGPTLGALPAEATAKASMPALAVVGTSLAPPPAAASSAGQHLSAPTVAAAPVPRDTPRGINKRYVVLTSRVHPGESQSSWMMKGMIDFLISDDPTARILRDHLVFKVVPMLNPEGVILGNHRCSLSGHDLNRCWLEPDQFMHPTIYYAKNMIMSAKLFGRDSILMFVDLHGHFRKKNVFMFGCNNDADPALRNRERVFPYLLSQNDPNFSFNDCDFKITRAKRTCGRVVVGKDLHVLNSFTMEATFAGMDIGANKGCHLDIGMLENIGRHLCETLLDFLDPELRKVTQTHEAICKVIGMKEPTVTKKIVAKRKTKKVVKKKTT